MLSGGNLMNYITIDGGTTNTRISLVKNKKVIQTEKLNVGAKVSMDSKVGLKNGIKEAISKILSENNLSESQIECVLASGMITSEFGLCSLEHIVAPAGIVELHNSMHKTYIKEISELPFVFIRGVKSNCDNIDEADMMRGEETELMGIISSEYGKCIYILPGSHSKIIETDAEGRITEFSTMLTGEMIAALSRETILKDAVDLNVSVLNSKYLLMGYDYCKEAGINKALFKVRILKNIFRCPKEEVYSFFIGVVLSGEIEQVIKSDAKTIVLGGKAQIKNAMAEILKNKGNKTIVLLDENTVNDSTSLGMIRVYEH